MPDDINRVCLWGIPRSMSTAITKCLSYVHGIQIINQPYGVAHFCGPDSKLPKPEPDNQAVDRFLARLRTIKEECRKPEVKGIDHTLMSYKWIREELLAAPFPGKDVVLCRDQAFYLEDKYDALPQGYKHSFLIRHPNKVLKSFKDNLISSWNLGEVPDVRNLPDILFPPGCGFKELYDLVEHVKANLCQTPVILDADDLLQDPGGVMSAYCSKIGIPYTSELLTWEAGSSVTRTWITGDVLQIASESGGFYDRALSSERFGKPTAIPDTASLSDDVQECVKFSMWYYERLHSDRIRSLNLPY